MYKKITFIFALVSLTIFSQSKSNDAPFKSGEYLKFRMHYGIVNAGYSTLEIYDYIENGQEAYHATGKGWTTGLTKLFFKIVDNYQTRFYKDTAEPYHFRRRVSEGDYIKSTDIYFNQDENTALVENHKHKTKETIEIDHVQDLLSSFYKLRAYNVNELEIGDHISLPLFLDSETLDFEMHYLGDEIINSKFGKVKCHKFIPIVQSGRIFEDDDSLIIWVTADKNKIPITIKAKIAVGSIKAELEEFKGLANPFIIVAEK